MDEKERKMKLAGVLGVAQGAIAIGISAVALAHAVSGVQPIQGLVIMIVGLLPLLGLGIWQYLLTRTITTTSTLLKDVPYDLFWLHISVVVVWTIYLGVFFVVVGITSWRYPGAF